MPGSGVEHLRRCVDGALAGRRTGGLVSWGPAVRMRSVLGEWCGGGLGTGRRVRGWTGRARVPRHGSRRIALACHSVCEDADQLTSRPVLARGGCVLQPGMPLPRVTALRPVSAASRVRLMDPSMVMTVQSPRCERRRTWLKLAPRQLPAAYRNSAGRTRATAVLEIPGHQRGALRGPDRPVPQHPQIEADPDDQRRRGRPQERITHHRWVPKGRCPAAFCCSG